MHENNIPPEVIMLMEEYISNYSQTSYFFQEKIKIVECCNQGMQISWNLMSLETHERQPTCFGKMMSMKRFPTELIILLIASKSIGRYTFLNFIFFHQYIHDNVVKSPPIVKYIKNQKRTCFCKCTDGCQNPKKCSCYKYNSSLFKPTYELKIHDNGTMIAIQQRAVQATNKNFTFNECHPRCHCHKDLCMNYLTNSQNKHRWKVVVRRITKQTTFFGK